MLTREEQFEEQTPWQFSYSLGGQQWFLLLQWIFNIGFLLSEIEDSCQFPAYVLLLLHCLYPVFQLSLCRLMMICNVQSCLVTVPGAGGAGDGGGAQSCSDSRPADTAGRRQSSAETSLGPYLIFSSETIEWNNRNKSERLACHGWLFLELI